MHASLSNSALAFNRSPLASRRRAPKNSSSIENKIGRAFVGVAIAAVSAAAAAAADAAASSSASPPRFLDGPSRAAKLRKLLKEPGILVVSSRLNTLTEEMDREFD